MVLVLGEFVGAEGGGPDAAEVVLEPSQVEGEGFVEEADGGQGLLQAVDRAGGGSIVSTRPGLSSKGQPLNGFGQRQELGCLGRSGGEQGQDSDSGSGKAPARWS
ncbi:hypothetical protein YW3DRAFT_05743 [Streptomyces sp. MnatMP-M77]|nr:hypothetical protein YW3DRAFT_05743 [Streptomyces sp. MnatMP-M77]